MSIVDWVKNDLNTEERTLTRDLLSVAVADKEFSDEEKKMVLEICQLEGISTVRMMDAVRNQMAEAKMQQTVDEKKMYLLHLIRLMMVDGSYSALELHVIGAIAKGIEVTPMQLLSFILDEVNAGHISKDDGITVIDHFVRRFIGQEL